MKIVEVKGLKIGVGKPKVCIPIVDRSKEEIINTIKKLENVKHDLIELRIDFFEYVENINRIKDLLYEINIFYKKPILFTFRNYDESGEYEINIDSYFKLNREVINSGLVDLIDLELFTDENRLISTIDYAHKNNVKVIISNHNFDKTISKEEMIDRLLSMEKLSGDIIKIAQMPIKEEDVLYLLETTLYMKKVVGKTPIISMSMGDLGKISRISGQLFGSCLTFGSLDKSSAPGQIEVEKLNEILELLNLDKE